MTRRLPRLEAEELVEAADHSDRYRVEADWCRMLQEQDSSRQVPGADCRRCRLRGEAGEDRLCTL